MAFFSTDFSSYTTGSGVPTGWSETWDTTKVDPEVVTTPEELGTKALKIDHSGTGRYALKETSLGDSVTDCEILTKFRVDSDALNANALIIARGTDGTATSGTAYVVNIRPSDGTATLAAYQVGGSSSTFGTKTITLEEKRWYWVRFRLEGTALKFRIWSTLDEEPSAWGVEYINGAYTTGWVGLGLFRDESIWDYFEAETDSANWPIALPAEDDNTLAWDPGTSHGNYSLSNNNRTALLTADGTTFSLISDWNKLNGKWYWEVTLDNAVSDYQSMGICDQDAGTDFDKDVRTGWNESWALYDFSSTDLRVIHDGSYSSITSTGFVDSDILQFALDIDSNKLWIGRNGTWFDSGNPAAGTGAMFSEADIDAVTAAAVSLRYDTEIVTSCFKASELTYTPPSGFSALDADDIYYSVDATKIDAALTDFPVGIKIESSTNFLLGLGSTDWQYIHATVDGVECYVEVNIWDTTADEAVLWVKVPTVSASADTVIKLSIGTLNTTHVGENGDAAAQNVWSEDFVAVYHMSQSPVGAGAVKDSTPNTYSGTPYGSMTSGDLVDAGFGKALTFDGVNDRLKVGWSESAGSWTFDFMIDITAETDEVLNYLVDIQSGRMVICTRLSSVNGIHFYAGSWSGKLGDLPAGMNHIVLTFNHSTNVCEYFLNGVSQNTDSSYSSRALGGNIYFGGYWSAATNIGQYIISEAYVSSGIRSDAWIEATNHVLNETLLTYSATDPDGPSVPTTTEPVMAVEGLGLSEAVTVYKEKIVGAVSAIGFDDALLALWGQAFSGLGLADTPGKTIEISVAAVSGFRLNDVGGAVNADVSTVYVLEGLGLSESATNTISISPPASTGIRFGEVSGAFLAVVKNGLADSGLGLGEISGAFKADVTTAGALAGIGFTEETARIGDVFEGGVEESLGFSGTPGRTAELFAGVLSTIGLGDTGDPLRDLNNLGMIQEIALGMVAGGLNYSAWIRDNLDRAVYQYSAYITGGPDGLADYDFDGLKSIQFRMRSGAPSYLSVVLPYSVDIVSAINARSNGQLVVDMAAHVAGAESIREELLRADFDSIRYDRGAKSQSLTLTGYKTQSFGVGTITLDHATTEIMDTDGTMRFRCVQPDFFLKPSHTVNYGAHQITADMVTCTIGPRSQSMEVSE